MRGGREREGGGRTEGKGRKKRVEKERERERRKSEENGNVEGKKWKDNNREGRFGHQRRAMGDSDEIGGKWGKKSGTDKEARETEGRVEVEMGKEFGRGKRSMRVRKVYVSLEEGSETEEEGRGRW